MMRSGSIMMRKLLLFLSCMAILLIACSCGFLEDETESPGNPHVESQGDINDQNISDLDALYSNDFGSVQVLYLTVSQGNSGETRTTPGRTSMRIRFFTTMTSESTGTNARRFYKSEMNRGRCRGNSAMIR